MGSALELIKPGWIPPLSLGTNPSPPCTELRWIVPLLFLERALASAGEKGRDDGVSTDGNTAGIVKTPLEQRCHFS